MLFLLNFCCFEILGGKLGTVRPFRALTGYIKIMITSVSIVAFLNKFNHHYNFYSRDEKICCIICNFMLYPEFASYFRGKLKNKTREAPVCRRFPCFVGKKYF